MKNILVMNGPNLNLLGFRRPDIYGKMTLAKLNVEIRKAAKSRGARVRFFQSNSEGALIDCLHANRKWANGVVINPGAYTHYSYALRDAIEAIERPVIEVHISDIRKREEFRRISVIEPVCAGQVIGEGWKGYLKALDLLLEVISS